MRALEVLDVGPAERILEIGCGQGIAASLVAERRSSGAITGIDRSAAMVELAVRRNRVHVERGAARFLPLALDEAGGIGGRFDKAFAINVRLDALERHGLAVERAAESGGSHPVACVMATPS